MKFARFVLPARTFRRPDSIGAVESIFIDLAGSLGTEITLGVAP
ncbi:MAG: hypothetical protein ABSC15_01585 [Terriglobales bacterium]|jgi:hypothetical protein